MTVLTNEEYRLLVLAVQANASADTRDKAFRLLNAKADVLRNGKEAEDIRHPGPGQTNHLQYRALAMQSGYGVFNAGQLLGRVFQCAFKPYGPKWAAEPFQGGADTHRGFTTRRGAAEYLLAMSRRKRP